MYVPYTLISLFKPSSADNNKTTVGTYAPMMILQTPFDDSVDIPDYAAEKLWITDTVNPQIP